MSSPRSMRRAASVLIKLRRNKKAVCRRAASLTGAEADADARKR